MADSVILERQFVPRDMMILRQGEEGVCAYLIQSGSVEVYTEHEGRKVHLAKLGTGQIFGEMALVFDEKRTASVKALEACNLIVISRETMKDKLERSDPTVRAIVQMLMHRVVSANNTALQKKETLDDLREAVRIIYQNLLAPMPEHRQSFFQSKVLPKLEAFLEAIEAFEEKFQD